MRDWQGESVERLVDSVIAGESGRCRALASNDREDFKAASDEMDGALKELVRRARLWESAEEDRVAAYARGVADGERGRV